MSNQVFKRIAVTDHLVRLHTSFRSILLFQTHCVDSNELASLLGMSSHKSSCVSPKTSCKVIKSSYCNSIQVTSYLVQVRKSLWSIERGHK